MLAFDTNILVYAANRDSPFYVPCRQRLIDAGSGPSPAFLPGTSVMNSYGLSPIRVHSGPPWNAEDAWRFVVRLSEQWGFELLIETPRHGAELAWTLAESPDIRGNLLHDLHTAVLMREHGVSRICTRDADFHRFPFLTVVDPSE